MKEHDLFLAIGGADEKFLAGAEKYRPGNKRKIFIPVSAAACAAVFAAVLLAGRINGGKTKTPVNTEEGAAETYKASADVTVPDLLPSGETLPAFIPETAATYIADDPGEKTGEKTGGEYAEGVSVVEGHSGEAVTADGGSYGGQSYFCIPLPPRCPASQKLKVTDEEITDAEIKAYFENNSQSLISSLSASGVDTNGIILPETGYCHVYYDGTDTESFGLRQNFRDCPVFAGDKLIAIVTLVKENGRIYGTPAFGGVWFDEFGRYLKAHAGQKLVFVYALNCEFVVAPDGTVTGTALRDVSPYLEGISDPYGLFYTEKAVYVP